MSDMAGPLIAIFLVVLVVIFIFLYYNNKNVVIYRDRPVRQYIRVRTHRNRRPRVIGGCAGTRFGCCPNSNRAKANRRGTNC